jgi:putative hydrolase
VEKVQILTDLHIHTIASAHAYSTLYENICAAKERGLELIAISDHAPDMPDSPHEWHFVGTDNVPRFYKGIKILCGVELNVLNKNGEIDLPERILRSRTDFAIASIHAPVYKEKAGGDHTETWLNIIKNPYIDILGHSGSPDYSYDIDTVVAAAKKADVCIEINNHSFDARPQNVERCRMIALACKKTGTGIVVNSDAHFMSQVGKVANAVKMLEDIDFPEELIMNLNAEKFIRYIEKKRNKKIDFGE